MSKSSKKAKETKKKKEVKEEEAEAPEVPVETEESEEPEKAEEAEKELTEEEILEAPEEEEIEAEEAEKEEAEEEIVEERIYTIPLDRAWISQRKKRAPRAVRTVQAFIQRHMKPEALIVSNEVNERIWSRGIRKPPRRIRVRAAKDTEGTVTVYLAEGD